ncbi:MAG: hypothetical protein IPJ37_03550 [Bacteroidales bacterium]|nr:hypothetical protein [Bacteroidales bacterium]
MKRISIRSIVLLMLMVVVSCDEPDTIVTNIVHPDGSVTRKIVMRYGNKGLKKSDIQVPFDNTWEITDSLEVGAKGIPRGSGRLRSSLKMLMRSIQFITMIPQQTGKYPGRHSSARDSDGLTPNTGFRKLLTGKYRRDILSPVF